MTVGGASRPHFDRVELDLPGDRTLTITPGTGPAGSGTINGRAITVGVVHHADLLEGGTLIVA